MATWDPCTVCHQMGDVMLVIKLGKKALQT
jgi:hypothetical protein